MSKPTNYVESLNISTAQLAKKREKEIKSKDLLGFSIRGQLYDGEDAFFKANPHVGGMAANYEGVTPSIILNPYSNLSDKEKYSVAKNEALRLKIQTSNTPIDFGITDEQLSYFNALKRDNPNTPSHYADNPSELKQTILGRLYSGDPAIKYTDEQRNALKKILDSK